MLAKQANRLTAPEVGLLWTGYMVDHMSVCYLTVFCDKAEDREIGELLNTARKFGEEQLEKRRVLFKKDKIALPHGFSLKDDIDLKPPTVFTDRVYAYYLLAATRLGLLFYSDALGASISKDMVEFLLESLTATGQLYKRLISVVQEKGIYVAPPVLVPPERAEFISKPGYLDGLLGDKRPLMDIEICGLYEGMELAFMMNVLNTAFAQLAKDSRAKELFIRAKKLFNEQLQEMEKLLKEQGLHTPLSYISEISNSTDSPFSDRLMLNHAAGLVGSIIQMHGYSLGYSMRKDLAVMYMKYIAEAGVLAEAMSKILIEYQWLEQPPGVYAQHALMQ